MQQHERPQWSMQHLTVRSELCKIEGSILVGIPYTELELGPICARASEEELPTALRPSDRSTNRRGRSSIRILSHTLPLVHVTQPLPLPLRFCLSASASYSLRLPVRLGLHASLSARSSSSGSFPSAHAAAAEFTPQCTQQQQQQQQQRVCTERPVTNS